MRVNAARDAASVAGAPRRESLLALVGSLKEQGWSYQEAVSLLGSLRLHLTFTAHPTETRRWTVRGHLADIALGARQPSRRRPRRAREPPGARGAPLGDLRAAQRAPQRRGRSAGRPGLFADGPLVGGPAPGRRDRAGGRGALRRAPDAAAAGGVPQLDRRRSRRQPQGASPRDRLGAAVRPFRGLAALRERARAPGARPLPLRSAREAARDAAPRDRRRAVGAGDSAHPPERAVSLPLPRDGPEAARAAGQRRSARSTTRRATCSAI